LDLFLKSIEKLNNSKFDNLNNLFGIVLNISTNELTKREGHDIYISNIVDTIDNFWSIHVEKNKNLLDLIDKYLETTLLSGLINLQFHKIM
jgi:hypothetical protein